MTGANSMSLEDLLYRSHDEATEVTEANTFSNSERTTVVWDDFDKGSTLDPKRIAEDNMMQSR